MAGVGPINNIQPSYSQISSRQSEPAVFPGEGVRGSELAGEESFPKANYDQAKSAVDKMNKTMETYNTELRFQLHEKSGEYIVKIINPKDDTVVREIPPEKVLDMVAYFKEMLGFMVDKFA
ncbi:flagellar protein FlaG [Desulforamulus aquiferis]|uniref:Flagellar protein FlaG n=1 Tax=Desulforamulus aquiferis TaxID=1397668 RepID=A0AAW7ZFV9_9FIRM|nr:flagellar protein FlaG [Desulforamulus aquiferis]MDO7788360.1 flagellar protein FlaG [Desulforamulus aquiferis]RYD03067.1 hypothetical protein N752_21900 [Desulforamulus aquiferis]